MEFERSMDHPIPSSPPGRRSSYQFHTMRVGESMLVPGKRISSVSSSAKSVGKRLGWTFTAQTQDGGVRIWRVS